MRLASEVARFAAKYRLRTHSDRCGEVIVRGSRGEIFEHSTGRLAVLFTPDRPFVWAYTRKKLLTAGFKITQDGDWEGCATFDPENSAQTRLAIRLVGARPKRQISAGQRKALAEARARRESLKGSVYPLATRPSSAQISTLTPQTGRRAFLQ